MNLCRKQSFLEALDFSEVRSYEDAKLLSDAKYGVRGKDGKMTREQYKCAPTALIASQRPSAAEKENLPSANSISVTVPRWGESQSHSHLNPSGPGLGHMEFLILNRARDVLTDFGVGDVELYFYIPA